jgi:hypothetical protein
VQDKPLPKVKYLRDFFRVTGVKYDDNYDKNQGRTAEGYTTNAGAPSRYMLEVNGSWLRVYIWQISNSGTAFVRIRGQRYIVSDTDLNKVSV